MPDSLKYFASVKEDELIFKDMPEMEIPANEPKKPGRRYTHMRPSISPLSVKQIAIDDNIPWETRVLGQGSKGPVMARVKCIRCVSCESSTQYGNYPRPGGEIWLYIRKYEDNALKYHICNAQADIPQKTLDALALMRWSIEQCFQECKSYLGMSHYEIRTYNGWHRHMLLVMIAHTFTIALRRYFKKTLLDYAYG